MNEELENKEHCNCFCNSRGFKKFLITALGSFVGVFCALSLFCALHRPPMMGPAPFSCHCPCCHMHKHCFEYQGFKKHHHFEKFDKLRKEIKEDKDNKNDD